ncbi:NAD(P)-dependent dehydrogenase (short-subunit alcohol dehydrogenase family) [Rhizobium sp. BK529]|uniref:SDR family NAD(P)-dependent oxidoreductase n=1 Tax=unclassified Rhizobium TaxID=2613769 RepID=UPI00104565B9|nr:MULTISPECIES: SDR family oxidoreductase [unclassified Rhizobium]MBB3590507.1 NAD(P)-dependent dehydrogenase (short-subunit alcohol dehydrogenase family) [Rhizobium sp. BK529]TCS05196.1 NAD(P)-dependent dehydrogenase (short-subunit alcohol dehydrogenase family) [Rhizobium sp. BK418]
MSDILKGKVALVTGGSRGLGAAAAEALAEQGADVAISYVASAEKAEAVVGKLRARGVRALAIQSDQADMAAAKPLVGKVLAYFGRLDILVNNAAIAVQGRTVDDPELDTVNLDRQWQVNVMGAVATTRAAAQVISDGGRIIFIGSLLGSRVPFSGVADYAGTKAAISGYAKGVARDLGRRNITVNVVQPGIMPTDMAADVRDNLPDAVMDLHPIRRIATLEEVSAAIGFLAGPNGGYISGGVIDISGGLQV